MHDMLFKQYSLELATVHLLSDMVSELYLYRELKKVIKLKKYSKGNLVY